MTRSVALGAALAVVALAPALAVPPELAVYVTDASEDVYVALYGTVAVELAACGGAEEARMLLQLPAGATASETTLARLRADFALGARPRIPCGAGARFDADWAAATPIWADLGASGNYYLPAPDGGGTFFAVPARCVEIKTALAIRERLQLPGVLQGLVAPEGLSLELLLDCGPAGDASEDPRETPRAASDLSLHRFDTFLSAASTGDTIYVARYHPAAGGGPPAYLPIWRVNGRAVSDLLLAGGDAADATEVALKELFGLPAQAAVTPLGAEAVAAVRAAVHADLCLANCGGYAHRHAAFLDPAADFGLTELAPGTLARGLNRLGEEQLGWAFSNGREVLFTSCAHLVTALGLRVPDEVDWLISVETALREEAGRDAGFSCGDGPRGTCLRRLADGAPLTSASFAPGADCPGARRLRIELPAAARIPAPLLLTGNDFDAIALAPKPGVTRSILTGTPGPRSAGSSSCTLSSSEALVFADGLPRLALQDVNLLRAEGNADTEVVALQIQGGALVLDGAALGGGPEGTLPLTRGVSLCRGDLYARRAAIDALALGIQGVSARLLLSGTASEPTVVGQPRYGLLLSADSAVRLDHARIVARTPLVLRGGRAVATRTELAPGATPMSDSTALMLERGASAVFTTSTARGFRCVAGFTDADAEARFVLPGNDLVRDNTHLACGASGQFRLLE
ncbi:MAG: hypothetical protein K8H90_02205 [Thermoanaerobaculia bacterium]|nr:hypothetical protein [Thermoanaerobaculia bacterium]